MDSGFPKCWKIQQRRTSEWYHLVRTTFLLATVDTFVPDDIFVGCELKLMLAHIVTTYDLKLEIEGVHPQVQQDSYYPFRRHPQTSWIIRLARF